MSKWQFADAAQMPIGERFQVHHHHEDIHEVEE